MGAHNVYSAPEFPQNDVFSATNSVFLEEDAIAALLPARTQLSK